MAQTDRLRGTDMALAIKAPCVVATTGANITLSSTQVIDGIAVGAGERVLVKDQTDANQNGVYVSDDTSWSRSADCDGARDLIPGTIVYVDRGTENSDTFWTFNSSSTATSIAISSDDITLSQVTVSLSGASEYGSSLVAQSNSSDARAVLELGAMAVASSVASTDIVDGAVSSAQIADSAVGSTHTNFGNSSTGAILFYGSDGSWKGVSLGSSGQVLGSSAGVPAWQDINTTSTGLAPPDYTASTQAVTVDTALEFAHGLNTIPSLVSIRLKCLTANLGITTGQELEFQAGTDGDQQISAIVSTTAIVLRQGAAINIHSTAFNSAAITYANWGWIIRAWI